MSHIWNEPVIKRPDGSYVVTVGGHPYHVPAEGGWMDGSEAVQWPDVHAWAMAHPDKVADEAPPPLPSLDEARAAKLAEIAVAHEAALVATLTMPAYSHPTQTDISIETAAWMVEDPDSLTDARAILAARRAELEGVVNAAESVDEVLAIRVDFPV